MRQRLIKMGQLLLAGAALSVIIAVGCAMWQVMSAAAPIPFEDSLGMFSHWFDGAVFIDGQNDWPRASVQVRKFREFGDGYILAGQRRAMLGYGIRTVRDLARSHSTTIPPPAVARHEAGWPLYCFRGEWVTMRAGAWVNDGCLLIKARPGATIAEGTRVMPLWPIWHGLAGNTLLYALMTWMTIFLWTSMKRRRRRRRGFCAQCGYDLRGVSSGKCAECGAAIGA